MTEFGYDARSQLNRVIAPNNATTTFDFDLLSRQTAEHSPDRGTITQEYGLADNLIASTDARGIRREMNYDAVNRLKTVTFPEPGEDITYTYDGCSNGIGRICRIDDESGTTEYEYDGFGNITRTTKTELGVQYLTDYEYDVEDRVTAIVYPSGRRVEYERDIVGRVTEVRAEVAGQMQSILSQIEYRADGQIIAAMFGNGLSETRTYDQQGRLVHQDLKGETGLIVDERSYSYDPAGNITARTGTPGDQLYNYDTLDRLIGQDIAADSKNWQYDYGPNHNRQTRTDGDLLEELYSYQPDTNRLLEIDKLFDQPDQTIPRSRQFIYNQANRFAEYIEDGETVASYTYNALGQRTRKKLETESTLFHYDTGIQLLAEAEHAGSTLKDHIWLGSRPIAQIESTGLATYLHTDHLLTPRIGSDDSQSIVWSWEGETFGDVTPNGSIEFNLRFAGQFFDRETSTHYNFNRYYSPFTGRYQRSDPIGLQGDRNIYLYAEANPIGRIDPLGLQSSGCRERERGPSGKWVGGSVGGGGNLFIAGGRGSVDTLVNTVTGERCVVLTICLRLGPGFGASGGGEFNLTWVGPYCGSGFTGGGCNVSYNAVKGLGISGSVGVCGGFATSEDLGPQAGAQLALTFDLCYVHKLSCSNSPCECK